MEFLQLETEEQLEKLKNAKGDQLIFKHNTTCPISKSVIKTFQKEAKTLPEGTNVYVLDLLAHRDVSDAIAREFNVVHESPQLLLIRDGQCLYDESGYDISAVRTADVISNN